MKKISLLNTIPLLLVGMVLLAGCGAGNEATEIPVAGTTVESSGTDSPEASVEATLAEATTDGSTGMSFANDVLPILQANCTRCHGSTRSSSNLRLDSFANVLAGGEDGLVIAAGDAAGSLLVQLVVSGEMPKGGAHLSDEDIGVIRNWIDAGALDN